MINLIWSPKPYAQSKDHVQLYEKRTLHGVGCEITMMYEGNTPIRDVLLQFEGASEIAFRKAEENVIERNLKIEKSDKQESKKGE